MWRGIASYGTVGPCKFWNGHVHNFWMPLNGRWVWARPAPGKFKIMQREMHCSLIWIEILCCSSADMALVWFDNSNRRLTVQHWRVPLKMSRPRWLGDGAALGPHFATIGAPTPRKKCWRAAPPKKTHGSKTNVCRYACKVAEQSRFKSNSRRQTQCLSWNHAGSSWPCCSLPRPDDAFE